MEEERDVIIVEDEDGQELSLEVIDYFLYDGVEYAVLVEAGANVEDDDVDAYMMQIQQDGEDEIFMPVDPEKFDEVSEAYLAMDEEDEDEEEL
ncbi:MAG: DUF1292 domain-containing protein [Clostridia bacterium]|nr:DUF1292 domain-containing protein [Clostridia bacterium]